MSSASDDLARELLDVFTLEATERVQALNEHVLALESAVGAREVARLLEEIFRQAHSLKGAARAVNLPAVEAVGHCLESLLLEMQKGSVGRDRDVFDLIYASVDAIGAIAAGLKTGDPESAAIDVQSLCERLDVMTAGGTESSVGDPPRTARGAAPRDPSGSPPDATRAVTGEATRPDETVRVATAKLDSLLAAAGELLAARSVAEENRAELHALIDDVRELHRRHGPAPHVHEDDGARLRPLARRAKELGMRIDSEGRHVSRLTKDLHEDVRRMRMMPVQVILRSLPRMVRDLSNTHGKTVSLLIEGADTEADRSVLEKVGTPLTHLLRNAVDHGIEDREGRSRAGKPEEGSVAVRVLQRGDIVRIQVADDGAGIDVARVVGRAIERGILTADEANGLATEEAVRLVFHPGLSTSPIITDVSGRGVGLDVVKTAVEELHGTLEVENRPGQGVTFSLDLPLTLATTAGLVVEVAGRPYALPLTNVSRTLRIGANEVSAVQGRDVVRLGDETLALARLADVLGVARPAPADGRSNEAPMAGVVVASGEKRMVLLVDGLLGMQEMVLKALPRALGPVPHVVGASTVGSGDVVMVLDVAEVMRSVGRAPQRAEPSLGAEEDSEMPVWILVADDSITTRTLERNILESAGYSVRVAADGLDAWTVLQHEQCDLLVTDVNMPRLDGFQLTEKIRGDARLSDLPVVLVTSLDKPEDRHRGAEVGADAYIVKGSFDQDRLLETVRRLV